MSRFFEKLPPCADGCTNTEPFTSKAGKEFTKCLDCKNLVFDKPRTSTTGRQQSSPRAQVKTAPYADPATLKLLALVEKMSEQIGELHAKISDASKD